MRPILLVLLVALVLTGCAPGAERPRAGPTPIGSRSSPSTPAPADPPVSRAKAGHVLRGLDPLTGFRVAAYCLNGSTDACELPDELRWSQYAEWRGRPLGRSPGAGRSFYVVAVLAHPDARASGRLLETVRRRSPTGRVDDAPQPQADGSVTYGRRGTAALREVRRGSWRGVTSVGRVALLQPGAAPARDVVTVDTALRRGRWSIQVMGWLVRRDGEPDPAVRLDLLTERVLDRLDQDYASMLRSGVEASS